MYNGVAAIGLGAYIVAVVLKGNASALIDNIKSETGFIQWLVAFLILLGIANNETSRPFGKPLIAVAFLAMAINASKDQTLWAGLQSLIELFNPSNLRSKT